MLVSGDTLNLTGTVFLQGRDCAQLTDEAAEAPGAG